MKEFIILMIKGFFFGIANIIPGVSGGTLAITMGIYEDLIGAISHFFTNFKKNIKFLIPIFLGAGLSILLMSKLISSALTKFPFPTTLFFIGLIVGGIPLLTDKIKNKKKQPINYALFLLTFGIVMILTFLKEGGNVVNLANVNFIQIILLFLVGVVAAATMVVPGISGSFVLLLLGYYGPITETIGKLTDFSLLGHNLMILAPFGLGVVIGIVAIAKIIEFLFKKYETQTYYAVLGFIVASIIALGTNLVSASFTVLQVIIGLILFILSFGIGYKLGDE